MVRIGGLVIVRLMASGTGTRRVEVVPVVAGGTVIGDQGMCAVEWIEIVVIGKESRIPVGVGGVTGRTIHGEAQIDVVGVDCLVEVLGVAGRTIGWCSGIACCMTGCTIHLEMAAGQWEGGQTVIEHVFGIAGGMTRQAGGAGIHIPEHTLMLIIRVGILVTGGAGELGKVGRVGMAFGTGGPLTLVFTGIDREIGGIVVLIGCRGPARIGGVAGRAVR